MSENTKIEWADHTFNPWIGCTQVGPGCDNCYAKAWDRRFALSGHDMHWGDKPRRRTGAANWNKPLAWNKAHAKFFAVHGRRQRVFCASLADVFDNEVDPKWRADLFALIGQCRNLDWLVLTKRIGNVRGMIQVAGRTTLCLNRPFSTALPDNVWIGATIVNQAEADRDIPKLLELPAAKRFLSMEPLLGPVDLRSAYLPCPNSHDIVMDPETGSEECCRRCDYTGFSDEMGIDWVIVGGESGPNARPMHPDWAYSLRDQCQSASVPFFFKQWGEWCPRGPESWGYQSIDDVPRLRMTDAGYNGQDLAAEGGNDVWMNRAGKKKAGCLLQGRKWVLVPV